MLGLARPTLLLTVPLILAAVVSAQPVGRHSPDAFATLREHVDSDRPQAEPAEFSRSTNAVRRQNRLVVTAFVGSTRTNRSALLISQPALATRLRFENVRLASRSFEPPLYYGLRVGYFFPKPRFLGVETEFVHLKIFADPQQRVRVQGSRRGVPVSGEMRLGEVVQQYSISHGANLLLFNAAVRRGFGRRGGGERERLILAARGGAGPTIPHTESNIEGNRQEQYELGRWAWQAAGGAEFRLWGGFYALGELKYTQTKQRGRIHRGTAESLLRTTHAVFGLSYHF